jgi:hypothetical protein
MDQDFLRELQASSACGGMSQASDALSLREAFTESRHASAGTVAGRFSGEIDEGEVVEAGTFDVPSGQAQLAATLIWPGSELDLVLVDPSGNEVTASYKGATFEVTDRLGDVVIERPKPGTWTTSVVGVDVPEGTTHYRAIVSVRAGDFGTSGSPAAVLGVTLVVGGLLVAFFFLMMSRNRASPWAAVLPDGRVIALRFGANLAGRGPGARVRLDATPVSRRHASIIVDRSGVRVEDLGSANGTAVNGRRVTAARLADGDEVALGGARIIVRAMRCLRRARPPGRPR